MLLCCLAKTIPRLLPYDKHFNDHTEKPGDLHSVLVILYASKCLKVLTFHVDKNS